jgi:hypothetical protein
MMRSTVGCLVLFLGLATGARGEEIDVFTRNSKLELSGRVQAQFHTTSVKEQTPSSTFLVRRARLKASWRNGSGSLTGRVQYDLAEGSAKLKDGYVELKVNDRFRVRMGQFKKPFSLWELTSSTKTPVIERANRILGTSNAYSTNAVAVKDGGYAGRDLGVQVHGGSGRLEYAFGLFNGNGDNEKQDDDSGKTFGARVVVEAPGGVRVGGAFSTRMVNEFETIAGGDTTVADESFHAVEADVEYGTYKVDGGGPWVMGEFQWGRNPRFGDTDTSFMGFMGVFAYNVRMPYGSRVYSVRPAVRFDFSERNTDDDDTRTILLTPGLDIFFDPSNRLAINLDVNAPNADDADTEFAIRAQFQMLI